MKDQPARPEDFAGFHDDPHGREAESPRHIPWRGWWQVLKRTASEVLGDHLPLVSAGVAFFFLLGLFPGLAAIVALYGWLADPASVTGQLDQLVHVLPPAAAAIIHDQAEQLASQKSAAGWGALLGLLLAIWAGSKATKGLVEALNIAYKQDETRGFFKKQGVFLGLTLVAVLAGVVSILLVAVAPAVAGFLPVPDWARQVLLWLRWPALLLIGVAAIATIYRYGPCRRHAKWRWVSWGAAGATVLWLAASALFSLYVTHFSNFNATYGSLGAVIILMLWLYLTAFLILLGAEVDAELEHQTRRDTTTHPEKPLGQRDAHVADHVAGESPEP